MSHPLSWLHCFFPLITNFFPACWSPLSWFPSFLLFFLLSMWIQLLKARYRFVVTSKWCLTIQRTVGDNVLWPTPCFLSPTFCWAFFIYLVSKNVLSLLFIPSPCKDKWVKSRYAVRESVLLFRCSSSELWLPNSNVSLYCTLYSTCWMCF